MKGIIINILHKALGATSTPSTPLGTSIVVIGFFVAFLGLIAFLPQAFKTMKTGNTKSLSLGAYLIFTISNLMWFLTAVTILINKIVNKLDASGIPGGNLVWALTFFIPYSATLTCCVIILTIKIKNYFKHGEALFDSDINKQKFNFAFFLQKNWVKIILAMVFQAAIIGLFVFLLKSSQTAATHNSITDHKKFNAWIVMSLLFQLIAIEVSICAWIPQVLKVIRTRDTSAISFATFNIYIFGNIVWIVWASLSLINNKGEDPQITNAGILTIIPNVIVTLIVLLMYIVKLDRLKNNKIFQFKKNKSRRYQGAKTLNELRLTIADTDYKFPNGVQKDLIKLIKNGDNVYTFLNDDIALSINKWYKKTKKPIPTITSENLIVANGAIHIMQIAIIALTKLDDAILCMPPVYPPIVNSSADLKRKTIYVPLKFSKENNNYLMDFEAIEKSIIENKVKMILFCNPHNPAGRVWNKLEILKLVDIAKKYNLSIISDEIWQDIYFSGHEMNPLVKFDLEGKYNFISISSGAKTFNFGGGQIGYGISYNKKFMKLLQDTLNSYVHYSSSSIFSAEALLSSYNRESNYKWYLEYRKMIEKNANFFAKEIKNTKLNVITADGLYLSWVDFKGTGLTIPEINHILLANEIFLGDGKDYGDDYKFFRRVNIGIGMNDLTKLIDILRKKFPKENLENIKKE
ncbi:MAG: aminotransferase class I/II-fold pyridoxal phosphate-dependent enzyme [Mycoplasmoidaceae bacterium]